ncbi:ATP-binding cassette domain-containing protein [Carboxydochorda subterranea]|uniref:ATP-binding cassette domain-containing protein n=1 Tax=Carboxydichorda subterranea TaxID=3109565 RepID=A0ABZ1BWM6_9FIRM|nr:ATP-binding cassette domain-containing protein [Limnochorda sp. L945t]WRP16951.1 ATP-binding cassette domain-containing protein [Limnochorda sp. L945t]
MTQRERVAPLPQINAEPDRRSDGHVAGGPADIVVEGLTKQFGSFVAVDHVSFEVRRGEVFGFLGPNGAGKSTTIRMLTTLLRPTAGTARVGGWDVVHDAGRVRSRIGLVAERIILYDRLSAAENLRLFGRLNGMADEAIRAATTRWLTRLGMIEWEDKLVGTFSTGMKQRVNIARALLHQPQVLFLDEPTLGLDPQTTRAIRSFIQELRDEGMTIVLTTHQMAEAEMLSDRVAIIDHGRIVALDTPEALKRRLAETHQTVIEMTLDAPSGEVETRLKEALPGLTVDVALTASGTVHVKVLAPSSDAIAPVVQAVAAVGAHIVQLHTVEPTLEDVFLHLTGHQIRDEVSAGAPVTAGRAWGRRAAASRTGR